MHALIDAALSRGRAVMLVLLMILGVGIVTYNEIPKEAAPDVKIPIMYVSVHLEGVSPEDAERLLLRPMEKELQSIEGLKELRGQAMEGYGSLILEFEAGFNSEKALSDVREKVDLVKPDLPESADEPVVQEINFSLFPVVNVILKGAAGERALLQIARNLRDRLEAIPNVLKVEIAGEREETLEVIVDPMVFESYNLQPSEVLTRISGNNILVPAGTLDTGQGRFPIKVPGLVKEGQDLLNIPVKVFGDTVLRLRDVAEVKRAFKDVQTVARVNGERALVLEVSKRSGANIINTVAAVREVVEEERAYWPQGIEVIYAQDESNNIINMVSDLQNNVIFAVLLVMLVILVIMGLRSSVLVAIAIPGAFLMGVLALGLMGYTMNIVVLFSLILSVGMLVDSAIVVCEYADRRMLDGAGPSDAYRQAAKRMAWPITASTITTLVVFFPLLVWPGTVGQFMKYMPVTLLLTLTASLLMAMIFIPVLGAWFGRPLPLLEEEKARVLAAERGDYEALSFFTRSYVDSLAWVLKRPLLFVGASFLLLCAVYITFLRAGPGVEFFPEVEPENAIILVHGRGNLAVAEQSDILREVERRIAGLDEEIRVIYSRAGKQSQQSDVAEDVIGTILLEFVDWKARRSASEILDDVLARTEDLAGIVVEARQQEKGPPVGKPVQVEFRSRHPELLAPAVESFLTGMREVGGFTDIEDDRPLNDIQWVMEVDRALAGQYEVNVQMVGSFIKLVTNGIIADTYRPDDADDEVDILARFPAKDRHITQLERLRVMTPEGAVPVRHFVKQRPEPTIGLIRRVDGSRVMTIKAEVAGGVLPDAKVRQLRGWLEERGAIDPRVQIRFRGEDEEQQEAMQFLMGAFVLALFGMFLVMVVQFNRVFQALIVMSAVFLSTAGVLVGLLIFDRPFGIVMSGVGVIALAGIVVNNNIIFIDTFRELREEGLDTVEALLRTGAQRLRPILLTAITTILGLVPMVFGININFIAREITFGAPSSQWWTQLSTTIASGLAFATVLTLFFTPALIVAGNRFFGRVRHMRKEKGLLSKSTSEDEALSHG